ncbi:hypothetical protein Ple7327_1401 [Pleurocapsa sp. PCC 7327]|nr:hypothetical protein Ple7327_1401 [Pleurocapsa sp. PCC 7327]
MSNKRKKRSQIQKFYCPCCQQRLWRLGGQKYYLFYQDISELKKNLGITRKKASFLATQNSAYVDRNAWLEEFFCEEHGTIWMRLSRQADGTLAAIPAKRSDWQSTTRTINPEIPNPSVSEFSYHMSRRASTQLV